MKQWPCLLDRYEVVAFRCLATEAQSSSSSSSPHAEMKESLVCAHFELLEFTSLFAKTQVIVIFFIHFYKTQNQVLICSDSI